ncbi:MAG: 50S ribosomal protein L22 [Candidatus Njordarchaeia archaeon]
MAKERSGYSFPVERYPDRAKLAIAKGVDLPIKYKHAREIANAIMEKKLTLKEAIRYLRKVMRQEAAVPFKRYKGNVAHRKELKDWKWPAGRYPYKASAYVIKVLENALNNARQKGLNEDRLRILLIAAHKGRAIRRRPDRRGPGILKGWKIKRSTNLEVLVVEAPEEFAEEEISLEEQPEIELEEEIEEGEEISEEETEKEEE